MKNLNVFEGVLFAVLVVGGVNWGLIGAFNINLVSLLFGDMTILTRIVYGLVGVSALYLALTALLSSQESVNKSSN